MHVTIPFKRTRAVENSIHEDRDDEPKIEEIVIHKWFLTLKTKHKLLVFKNFSSKYLSLPEVKQAQAFVGDSAYYILMGLVIHTDHPVMS
jgi:hypothetical protein